MIETDYINGSLIVKRGDKVIKTFKFKDFVSAKQFKPVNDLRSKLIKVANGSDVKTEAEVDKMNIEFYTKVTTIGLENPMTFTDVSDIVTIAELAKISEEVLIFLVNWSSIDAVKQYAQQLLETPQNDG